MIIGFLGFGTISRLIYQELNHDQRANVRFWGFYDPFVDEIPQGFEQLHHVRDMQELLDSPVELIVEAAQQDSVGTYIPDILRSGKNVVSMSVGAYLDEALYASIDALCREAGSGTLYIPSGALPAVDAIQAASLRNIERVELVTRKPYEALRGTACFDDTIKESSQNKLVTVFSGSAREAVKLFPKNVNLSATLSIAGIGAEKTRVTIIADPSIDKNIHTVTVTGDFGELTAEVKANPSQNPRTSLTAPLSAVSLIKRLSGGIQIGS